MTSRTVTVWVKESDGVLAQRTRTIWGTRFGPVIENQNLPWTATTAYAVGSVVSDFRWLNQHYGMNTARSVAALDSAGRRYMALTWINTVAADDQGHVIYGDRSSVPHVTDEQRAACTTSDLGKQLWQRAQLVVFDGWRKECEWGSDPDSPVPGIFGATRLPMLDRWDYATNSNDSHWANNARQLLEGYPAIVGDERTQRSLRTRNGLNKIERRIAGTDGLPGKGFSLAQLEAVTMNDRVYSAELWRDTLVEYCRSLPAEQGNPEACDVLARWDQTDNLDSPGSVLWRRFMENISPGPQPAADLFTVPLDPKDPANTPRGLNVSNPKVSEALAKAIADLKGSGMPLDARIGDYQVEERSGQRFPIHGGPMSSGQYNLIFQTESGWVPGKGWRQVLHASSYIAWVQFTDHGPVARSVLASSQSDDPKSAHHADQTALFSRKESKPVLFDETAIKADPALKVVRICRTPAGGACR